MNNHGQTRILGRFYQRTNWMPEQIRNDIGHFNVFRLEPLRRQRQTHPLQTVWSWTKSYWWSAIAKSTMRIKSWRYKRGPAHFRLILYKWNIWTTFEKEHFVFLLYFYEFGNWTIRCISTAGKSHLWVDGWAGGPDRADLRPHVRKEIASEDLDKLATCSTPGIWIVAFCHEIEPGTKFESDKSTHPSAFPHYFWSF